MNISDLQITTGNWHAGLTQATHLSTFFQTEPAMASEVVFRAYNMQNGYKNTLSFLTGGLGKSKEIDNIQYRWPMMGDSDKAITITGNFSDGGSTPGINFTSFRVKVAEKWFQEGDNVVFDDNDYVARVEAIETLGAEFVLTLRLVTRLTADFIPAAQLAAGKQLSKDFNSVEHDHSRTAGGTHYAQPFMLENYLTTFRKEYAVTGAAASKVLIIGVMDPSSKKVTTSWVKYAEWEFWKQWMDELEKAFMFGKCNVLSNGQTTMKGASGNPIYQGYGLEGQISPGNKRYYTALTEKVIRDFMSDLSYNGTEDSNRNYVALCGRGFMDLFDQAMKDSASKFTLVDSKFVTGSGQELSLGGQFVSYKGLNGDMITLKEYSPYNKTVRNRTMHPQLGRPAESYKATFINFKGYGQDSNVTKVYHREREMVTGYIEGMYGPFGPKKNGTMSSKVDGYEFQAMSECGIWLKDPTDAGQLILDVDSIS